MAPVWSFAWKFQTDIEHHGSLSETPRRQVDFPYFTSLGRGTLSYGYFGADASFQLGPHTAQPLFILLPPCSPIASGLRCQILRDPLLHFSAGDSLDCQHTQPVSTQHIIEPVCSGGKVAHV